MSFTRATADIIILGGFPTVILLLFLNTVGVVGFLPSTVFLLWVLAFFGLFAFIGGVVFKFFAIN